MDQIIQLLIQAFTLGSFYTLLTLGFALIFGVTHVLNISHGEFIILSGYIAYYMEEQLGMALWQALPVCIFVSILSCLALKFLICQNSHTNELHSLIMTFGIALIMQSLFLGFFSADYRIIFHKQTFFFLFNNSIMIGSLQLYLITLSFGTILLLFLLFRKTFVGKALRATIQDKFTARLVGISINKMQYLALILGGIAIGIAGPLYARISYVHPAGGIEPTLIALVITIFAGKGHIRGLLYGGWLLGIVETLAAFFMGTEWKELVSALFLIAVIIWRHNNIYEN